MNELDMPYWHTLVAVAWGVRHPAGGKLTKSNIARASGISRQLVHRLLPIVYALAEAHRIELPALEETEKETGK
jgi:hypothetical protein